MSDMIRCQLTDTMIRVQSIEKTAKFWVEVMGMIEVERSPSGIILEDPRSMQRIAVVDSEMSTDFALAVATDNMASTLQRLREGGAVAPEPETTSSGLEYALCESPSGVPIMVYVTE